MDDLYESFWKAASEKDLETIRALIGEIPNLNQKDEYGWTAIQMATNHGHLEMVSLLLAAGAASMPTSWRCGSRPIMTGGFDIKKL